jgi:choice-of-anchor B domain-containing protein
VSEDGYTHDTQCVNYSGPDERFSGQEICFSSNEDTVTIVNVTDKDAPVQLSRTGYDSAAYTHQGWLTPDQRYLIVDDELDEQEQGGQTKTYIFDVGQLDNPRLVGVYDGVAESIDHNLYTVGNRVFQANYRSGLRVLDSSGVADGTLSEVGFFDVYPPDDEPEFNGAWSNYPYFGSGVVVVSGIEQGLFVLRPQGDAAVPAAPAGKTKKPKKPRSQP